MRSDNLASWEALSAAFLEADPEEKCRRVRDMGAPAEAPPPGWALPPITGPGRPLRPILVPPRRLPRRGLGSEAGRAAFLHAVAHIEFNAINLALDAVLRFPQLPDQYREDWLSVARDEARHYSMLSRRLAELGTAYGDYDAHDGLWEAAVATAHDPLARMAIVPRVLEARGLDVTPGMIERLQHAGDENSAGILAVILEEEVRHVRIGSHWFRELCTERGLEPEQAFHDCVQRILPRRSFPGMNRSARLRAGFSVSELRALEAAN